MKLLIVEPEATGHHMALYTRLIVEAARRRGWHLHLLTTKEAIVHPSFLLVEAAAEGELTVHLMPTVQQAQSTDSMSLLASQLARFRAISKGFRALPSDVQPDFIYVVNLDHCDKIISLLGSPFGNFMFSGMMMGLNYHRLKMGIGPAGRSDRLYAWLFRRLLKLPTIRKVAVIDEVFIEYAGRAECSGYSKLHFVPDPGELRGHETRDQARATLGILRDRFIILVYGSLTLRKGIRELLNTLVLEKIPLVSVLLVGTLDENIKELLREPDVQTLIKNDQLHIHAGFHDSQQEYRVFRAVDAVWVGYVGNFFGSSGVFYQAGSLGLPVLASENGLLGWLVKRYRNGICFDPGDTAAVATAISSLFMNPQLRTHLGENGRCLSQLHTGELFGDAVCETF
jgi:glycosyltransferase involved in cell wall biosynthesis